MDKAMQVFQMFLAICNSMLMIWMFRNFLRRPHEDLKAIVTAHDVEIKEIKSSLRQGNDRFREQDNANEVIINSVLALVEFEIQYCLLEHKELSDSLEESKRDLNRYLARRYHEKI